MCAVSMVMDHYNDKWKQPPYTTFPAQPLGVPMQPLQISIPVSRAEFDQLRADVLEMKELVKRALEYDRKHDQPDCESAEKIAMIRKVAEMVGVNVDDVFGQQTEPRV